MAGYWRSKKSLFTRILPDGPKGDRAAAVINRNDPRGRELAAELAGQRPLITFGRDATNTVRPEVLQNDLTGLKVVLHTPKGAVRVRSALVGDHNLENIMTAAGCAMALDLPLEAVRAGVAATGAIPGRLEAVPDLQGRFIYVDYAHTPDALENVLNALNALRRRRLICVFGCGGDRDRRKRPLMGEIAGRLSDLAILTSDNPRTEDPLAIIADALKGVRQSAPKAYEMNKPPGPDAQPGHMVVPDRREAIRLAVRLARPDDTILIAGKGHETYQVIGRTTIPFDDREEVVSALTEIAAHAGKERA